MKLVQEFVHHSHILCSGSLLLAQNCESGFCSADPRGNDSRMFLRVHISCNTKSPPQWLFGIKLEVLFWFGASSRGQAQFQWPGEVDARGAQLVIDVCVHQEQSGLKPRHKWLSHHRDSRRVPRGPDCVKSKFSSLRNSQTKEFPILIPKQRPFEMPTTSPDTSTDSVCSSSWFYLKLQQLEEQLLVMSWVVFIVSAESGITEGGQGMFFPISGAFEWV